MRRLVLVVHNLRSAHNVGSILRSADGFAVDKVYLTGYTPYPITANDTRLPHVARRTAQLIAKTALGAENTVEWQPISDIYKLLSKLKSEDFLIAALEQTSESVDLPEFDSDADLALVVGNEIGGIEQRVLKNAAVHLAIPMLGQKESFNVSIATSVALYHLRWYNRR